MKAVHVIWTGALLLLAAPSAQAQSIYQRRTRGTPEPYVDRTAHSVGDLVTILIRERQQVKQADETSSTEGGSFSAALESFGINPATFAGLPELSGSSERTYDGEATIQRRGTVEARLTARVHAVQPNGNLVLIGRRETKIDNDRRTVEFHGVVRPDDVSANNVVESERVSDARFAFLGDGPGADSTNRGVVGRVINAIIDFVWPF